MPFSIHQVAEYALGLGLIAQAVQGPSATVPVLLGAAILLSAALTDGPLAGWKAVSRPAHRVVDIVLAITALGPGRPAVDRARRRDSRRAAHHAAAARAAHPPHQLRRQGRRGPHAAAGDVAEDLGRSAGRLASKGVKAYRDRRPSGSAERRRAP